MKRSMITRLLALTLSVAIAAPSMPVYAEETGDTEATEATEVVAAEDVLSADDAAISENMQLTLEHKPALDTVLEDLPETVEVETKDGDRKDVAVTWECADDYDEKLGEYEFTPVLAKDVQEELADDAEVPGVTVTVENEENGLCGAYLDEETKREVPVWEAPEDMKVAKASNDSYYNGYTQGYLPPVRNQDTEGACWAYAVIGAVEANLIKKGQADKSLDLSEEHLAYFATHNYDDPKDCHDNDYVELFPEHKDDWLSAGGNLDIPTVLFENKVGPVLEKDFHALIAEKAGLNDYYALGINYAQVKNVYQFSPEDRASIKSAIKSYGSVAALIHSPDNKTTYYSATNNSQYGTASNITHAVMLVGMILFLRISFHRKASLTKTAHGSSGIAGG